MIRILALDLASVAGAAWRNDAGEIVRERFVIRELAGIPESRQAKSHPQLFRALERHVAELLARVRPDVLAIEKDTGRGFKSTILLQGYRAVAMLPAADAGVRVIADVSASDARKLVGLPAGNTPKEIVLPAARVTFGVPDSVGDDELDAEILLRAIEVALGKEAAALAAKPKRTRKAA